MVLKVRSAYPAPCERLPRWSMRNCEASNCVKFARQFGLSSSNLYPTLTKIHNWAPTTDPSTPSTWPYNSENQDKGSKWVHLTAHRWHLGLEEFVQPSWSEKYTAHLGLILPYWCLIRRHHSPVGPQPKSVFGGPDFSKFRSFSVYASQGSRLLHSVY